MTRVGLLALGLWASCLVGAARANAPVVDRPESKSGEAGLWMQVDEIEKRIAISPLVMHDPALNAYVHGIVCRLAGADCPSLRIYVLDDPDFNAAAWPNGMVTINTGLLLRTENEAQLAFVLGHEITHYLKRHSWNRFDSMRETSDVLAFLSIGVAAAGVGIHTNLGGVSSLASLAAAGALFSYSRDQEREADAGGFQLAVANGYDPRQGQTLWSNVDDEVRAEPDRHDDLFFATHPTDKERLQTMAKLADQAEAGAHANDLGADRLRAAVGPHRADWLGEELNRGHLSQSVQMISRLIKADASSGELRYFLGEAYRRRNADGDLASAVSAYEASIAGGGGPVSAYRGLGIAALKSGDMPTASGAFRKYLDLAPAADDRAMVQSYLSRAEGK